MTPVPTQLSQGIDLDRLERAVDDMLSQRMDDSKSRWNIKSNILFGKRFVDPYVKTALHASEGDQAKNCSIGLTKRTNRTYDECCIRYHANLKKVFIKG